MNDETTNSRHRSVATSRRLRQGHDLVTVTERIPGREPTDCDQYPDADRRTAYRTRYWRCRCCGQERNQPEAFREQCPSDNPPLPLSECGYDPLEPRTRRALTEDMTVSFDRRGPTYAVESESGQTYEVDIAAETCRCPDFEQRHAELEDGCKHLRRVHLAVAAAHVPRPDGQFGRGTESSPTQAMPSRTD